MIGTGLGTLLPVQNTKTPICNTSVELHQYSYPNPTSDLTYPPKTTPLDQPQNPNNQAVCVKSFQRLSIHTLVLVGAASVKKI